MLMSMLQWVTSSDRITRSKVKANSSLLVQTLQNNACEQWLNFFCCTEQPQEEKRILQLHCSPRCLSQPMNIIAQL